MVSFLEEWSDEKSEVPFSEKPEDTVTMRIFGGWWQRGRSSAERDYFIITMSVGTIYTFEILLLVQLKIS